MKVKSNLSLRRAVESGPTRRDERAEQADGGRIATLAASLSGLAAAVAACCGGFLTGIFGMNVMALNPESLLPLIAGVAGHFG